MDQACATLEPAAAGPAGGFWSAAEEHAEWAPWSFPDRRQAPSPGERFPPWRVKRLEAFLGDNLEKRLTIEILARAVGLSCRHFARCCRNTFGVTSHKLVLLHRIERAQALLRQTRAPLAQIALACGFADQSHFSRMFRQIVGASPRRWRRDNSSSHANEESVP